MFYFVLIIGVLLNLLCIWPLTDALGSIRDVWVEPGENRAGNTKRSVER